MAATSSRDPDGLRAVLREAGHSPRAVQVDDGSALPVPFEGAVRLAFDAGWSLTMNDYGMSRRLGRFDTFDEARLALLRYLSPSEPEPLALTDEEFNRLKDEQAATFAPYVQARRAGTAPNPVELAAGTLVDHFGAPDGFLLYLPSSRFFERSLPLSAMDETRRDFGWYIYRLLEPVAVETAIVPPSFGQPGGAPYFRLLGESTIRRLLEAGALCRVNVPLR